MPTRLAEKLVLLRDRPLETLTCLNPDCADGGARFAGLLSVRYWRCEGTIRYLRCNGCGIEFSEPQGNPFVWAPARRDEGV